MNLWPSTLRAALAGGLAAGVVAATFSVVVVEPTVRAALAVEDSRTAMEHALQLGVVDEDVDPIAGQIFGLGHA